MGILESVTGIVLLLFLHTVETDALAPLEVFACRQSNMAPIPFVAVSGIDNVEAQEPEFLTIAYPGDCGDGFSIQPPNEESAWISRIKNSGIMESRIPPFAGSPSDDCLQFQEGHFLNSEIFH